MRARISFIGPRCCITCGSMTAMRPCRSRGRPRTSQSRRLMQPCLEGARGAALDAPVAEFVRRWEQSGDPETTYALAPMLSFCGRPQEALRFSNAVWMAATAHIPRSTSIPSGRGCAASRVPAHSHQGHGLPRSAFAAWLKPTAVRLTRDASTGPRHQRRHLLPVTFIGFADVLHQVAFFEADGEQDVSAHSRREQESDPRSSSARPRKSAAIPRTAGGARSCRGTV